MGTKNDYSLMRKKQNYLWVGHFTTLSGHILANYLSQNWASDNHFDVPNMPKSYLDQKLQHKTQFFSFPVLCHFVKEILKIYDP